MIPSLGFGRRGHVLPTFVVDASVVLKWQFEDEEASREALALRDDFLLRKQVRLVAPPLLMYELANGVVMAIRRARISMTDGKQALRHLLLTGIELIEVEPRRTFQAAMRFGLSAYDGAYTALGQRLRAELLTGDRAFYDAVRKTKQLAIRWIGDYQSRVVTLST